MCLAKAYMSKWDNELMLQDIAGMQVYGDFVKLETLLGEEQVVSGRVVEVDFLKSRILLAEDKTSQG